ncbi:ankyrin repeat-containing domain protein, partial [Mycena crocata]
MVVDQLGNAKTAEASFFLNAAYGSWLSIVSHHGDDEVVRLLLDRGADVNAENMTHDCGALKAATCHGQYGVVHLLLEGAADVNSEGAKYDGALHDTCCYGHLEVISLLLENGANGINNSATYGCALQVASHCDPAERKIAERSDLSLIVKYAIDRRRNGTEVFEALLTGPLPAAVEYTAKHNLKHNLKNHLNSIPTLGKGTASSRCAQGTCPHGRRWWFLGCHKDCHKDIALLLCLRECGGASQSSNTYESQ